MTGTINRRRTANSRSTSNDWRDKLFGVGALAATFGVIIADIVGAYEWQMLTVLAAGLTAMLGSVAVCRDTLQLQYRAPRFVLTLYVFSAMLVGMTWAGAFANSSDVLNVLWYGLVAWGLSVVFFWMPAKKKPGKVFTVTSVRAPSTPWTR